MRLEVSIDERIQFNRAFDVDFLRFEERLRVGGSFAGPPLDALQRNAAIGIKPDLRERRVEVRKLPLYDVLDDAVNLLASAPVYNQSNGENAQTEQKEPPARVALSVGRGRVLAQSRLFLEVRIRSHYGLIEPVPGF